MGKARASVAGCLSLRTHNRLLSSCALGACVSLIGWQGISKDRFKYSRRVSWCMEVQRRAEVKGVDPLLVAGLAFHESGFRDVTSRKGAQGVMQVMPDIHCKDGEPCDLIDAGLEYLQYWLSRTKSPVRAICHYNSGNRCKPAGARWAVQVIKTVDKLHNICEEANMPKVGKKKFPYTTKGKADAKTYAKKTKKKGAKKR